MLRRTCLTILKRTLCLSSQFDSKSTAKNVKCCHEIWLIFSIFNTKKIFLWWTEVVYWLIYGNWSLNWLRNSMTKGIDNIKGKNGFHVWSKNWEKPLQVNAFKSLKCSNVLGMTFADVEYSWYLYVQSITLSWVLREWWF